MLKKQLVLDGHLSSFVDVIGQFKGVACDSQKVEKGFIFAGLQGQNIHGEAFLGAALERGAQGYLSDQASCARAMARYPYLSILTPVENPQDPFAIRQTFAQLAAHFWPERPGFIAGITGTNGKSSVVGFAQQLWTLLGKSAASLGTLGLTAPSLDSQQLPLLPSLTTPDAFSLHHCLQGLKPYINYLAMEVASHGLAQGRCDGVRFQAAVLTNLSQDHLDYHSDMNSYFQAKCRLFHDLLDPQAQVLLHDHFRDQKDRIFFGQKTWFYGSQGPHLQCLSQHSQNQGQTCRLNLWGQTYEIFFPLPGAFQVDNFLAALGIVVASGCGVEETLAVVPHLRGLPGRLEWMGQTATGGHVYVDFAHTPAALETVLEHLRTHTTGQLIVVFGCGGDRDQNKRPLMGRIAQKHADRVIITDDNPRFEPAHNIRKTLLEHCAGALEIADRAQAIIQGMNMLGPQDILVVAGKGHETGQIVEDKILPFQDQAVIKSYLYAGRSEQ